MPWNVFPHELGHRVGWKADDKPITKDNQHSPNGKNLMSFNGAGCSVVTLIVYGLN
jgi:hypothetical protein